MSCLGDVLIKDDIDNSFNYYEGVSDIYWVDDIYEIKDIDNDNNSVYYSISHKTPALVFEFEEYKSCYIPDLSVDIANKLIKEFFFKEKLDLTGYLVIFFDIKDKI